MWRGNILNSPVERHQLVFLNPDLAGLFAAYLSHRAGADIAVIDEHKHWQGSKTGCPVPFPAGGTFYPENVDLLATETGFPPPVWETVPHLILHLPDRRVTINADDGLGGLHMTIIESIRKGRATLSRWLQNQAGEAEKLAESGKNLQLPTLGRVMRSVAVDISELQLPEFHRIYQLFDIMSIVVLGRGIAQLDVRNFPYVLAGIFKGWTAPAPGEKSWAEILALRLRNSGARWHEVSAVRTVQSFGRRSSVVRGSDGALFAARILVVPENDRFYHPVASMSSNAIRWKTWCGCCSKQPGGLPIIGVVRSDPDRPPVNDAFITYHLRPDIDGKFVVSAPVEDRYLRKDARGRLESLTARIRFQLTNRLGWQIDEFKAPESDPDGEAIDLPGTASAMSYPEGPLWGDDVLTRLIAADRLSKRVLGRLK